MTDLLLEPSPEGGRRPTPPDGFHSLAPAKPDSSPRPDRSVRLRAPTDVMVDPMRGRSTTWTRIRVNLRNVPEADRPAQDALEVDYDPWEGVEWPQDPSSSQEGGDSPS